MQPGAAAAQVGRAIEAFTAGDDEAFLASVSPDVVIWSNPQLAREVVLHGRDELAAWCDQARKRWRDVRFDHGELSEHGSGVYVELDVITATDAGGGAWRMPIAVFFRDGAIVEVTPADDRDSALAALEGS